MDDITTAGGCAADSVTLGGAGFAAGQLGFVDLTPEKSAACDIGSGGGDIAGILLPGPDILKAGQLGIRGAKPAASAIQGKLLSLPASLSWQVPACRF